jgi:N-carbamoylputrescine amidase
MRVAVCQFSDDRPRFSDEWEQLVAHARAQQSELVLLNEFVFAGWFPESKPFAAATWQAALADHDAWLKRLDELAPAVVLGTRPVEVDGQRLNEGFVWTAADGYRAAHHKVYLPEDPGFWESSWYSRGAKSFDVIPVGSATVGFTICTEVWFMQHARDYGQAGATIIAAPRATGFTDKWLAGGRSAAVISGAFHLSSNRAGTTANGTLFGGGGWIIDPDGKVLALTSDDEPFITLDIDLQQAVAAKSTYPRYVEA